MSCVLRPVNYFQLRQRRDAMIDHAYTKSLAIDALLHFTVRCKVAVAPNAISMLRMSAEHADTPRALILHPLCRCLHLRRAGSPRELPFAAAFYPLPARWPW